jgi:hypothetical protein
MISNIRKKFQRFSWHLRSYILPAHVRTYWQIIRHHALTGEDAGKKFVYFDFRDIEIETMSGRYLFSLVCDFEALGFLPCYRKNFRFLASMKHREFKRLLLDRPFRICKSVDELPADSVIAEVTDRPEFQKRAGRRQIFVRYDITWPRFGHEIPMTFFVHPLQHDQFLACPAPALDTSRPWRVFFAGRTHRGYGSHALPQNFGKMSRVQMLQTLESALSAGRLHRLFAASDLETLIHDPHFVWAQFQIPRTEWMNILSRADFFLACPGHGMPLCHNLIESLSRGVVPILEHPEFLDPPLEHNVNCLSFRGPEELIKTVERTFQMDQVEVHRLRQNAYAYYQKHLAPGAFASRLITSSSSPVELLLKTYRTPRVTEFQNWRKERPA